ncbi:sugar phosphate isomerase/epimerase [Chelatococcus sp. SYSU_G07232]|uniref:Sugar phosphate isomerase/epimerase n=1 Tax=Chelatococcus albus TaxID=3047466 RepID=A0ABT7AJI0_9HYPH|nr:sugar phosphate isomerase/epimerase [Chelatococcus sp. SYSU_G07232]MDJ1159541.1 sugar phosphate isomerase/epimerase [Chelatococcus sp. SYSU_G07232]
MSDHGIISGVGFCTGTGIGDLSVLEAALARFVALRADVAELSLYGEDLIAGGRVIGSRAQRLAEICRRYPLRYTVHGQIVSNFMDEPHLPLQKAVVRAMLELCDRVGATVLVHHSGTAPAGRIADHTRYDTLEREALAEMAEVARGYGVRIALENIFAMSDAEYRQSPAEVAATVQAIGRPNLCALLDFSHAYIECTRRGLDWREQIRAMAAVAGHLHVHDSFGRPCTMTHFHHPCEATALGIGDLHLPLGWGDIPWEELFAELTFLPDTALVLEITERYDAELPESLALARRLAARANVCGRVAAG